MINGQINGSYDVEYFERDNEYNTTDSQLWWSSASRYSEDGEEYVEINLEKKRTINYISFDTTRKPVDIVIEYDSIDLEEIDDYSNVANRWVPVRRMGDELFDSSISYESDVINPWKHCQFYFTDNLGNPLMTQRIRIRFARRVENWPTSDFPSFRWSIDVRALRVGRFITRAEDTVGVLIETPSLSGKELFKDHAEIRQRFYIPDSALIETSPTTDLANINGFEPSNISPRLMGFEILVDPFIETSAATLSTATVDLEWFLYDVTYFERFLDSGQISQEVDFPDEFEIRATSELLTPAWARATLNAPIETEPGQKFEIRVRTLGLGASAFYTSTPTSLRPESGDTEYSDLYYADNSGATRRNTNTSLTYRVLADNGMFGKDLLGNEYREGVRYNSSSNAIDGKLYTNWTSFPNPSSEGVEALYFDVRTINNGFSSMIDAIEVNTLTPGVRMNVYYSNQPMISPPRDIDDWEDMMWTPIRDSFQLDNKQTIDFPYPVFAKWICLEFYNLQPILMSIPNYPILPEVEFKEFPDWVYDGNPPPLRTNDEPYLEREKFVSFSIPEMMAGQIENQKALRVYADTPQTLEENYEQNGFGTADPEILSNVSFSRNAFSSPTVTRIDQSSLLGQNVYDDYISDYRQTYIAEAQQYPRVVSRRNVSNTNNRLAASRDPERILLFNRVCAHQYAVRKARYNKKAYSVSISDVSFLKKDYTAAVDDDVINDLLVLDGNQESLLIESSTWEAEESLSIPVASAVFVTYYVGERKYQDEVIYFEPPGSADPSYAPVDLIGGGRVATRAIARSGAFGRGDTYFRDQDFLIAYDPATKKNRIQRNNIPARLVVGNITHSLDRGVIIGVTALSSAHETIVALMDAPPPAAPPISVGTATVSLTFPEDENVDPTDKTGLFGPIPPSSSLVPISSSTGSEGSTYATLENDELGEDEGNLILISSSINGEGSTYATLEDEDE
jgi:hypothetical protein